MEIVETIDEILAPYPHDTAVICYKHGDHKHLLFIAAKEGIDNDTTLRAHLADHFPDTEFLWWAIK